MPAYLFNKRQHTKEFIMFIKQFISTFKKVRLEYKIYLQEQREKKALLSAKSDFSLLEKLIQAVNKCKWCIIK